MSKREDARTSAMLTLSMFREPLEEGGKQSIDVVRAFEGLIDAALDERFGQREPALDDQKCKHCGWIADNHLIPGMRCPPLVPGEPEPGTVFRSPVDSTLAPERIQVCVDGPWLTGGTQKAVISIKVFSDDDVEYARADKLDEALAKLRAIEDMCARILAGEVSQVARQHVIAIAEVVRR